jgi:hypothetical protein
MKQLYICSTQSYSGKSALGLGLALEFKDKGADVGYFKPIGTLPVLKEEILIDEDAHNMFNALNKPDNVEDMSPLLLTSHLIERFLRGEVNGYKNKVLDSYKRVSAKHEILIIEGGADLSQGKFIGLSAKEFLDATNAPAILVVKEGNMNSIDQVLQAKSILSKNFAGVVFMSIPENKMTIFKNDVCPFLSKNGIRCFGLLPRDRILSSVTVAQIREALSGKILTAKQSINNLVETFLVGAMGQERALRFFRKKVNKAVITGGDRADLQMAALETPTRCIILTGNLMPSPSIMGRAEQLQVPIIMVEEDTWTTVQKVEKLTGRLSMDKPVQIRQMRLLLEKHFNFELLEDVWKETA